MFALKRINDFGLQHPWRAAALGFLFFVLISALVLDISGHNLFGGLFGAYGAMLGTAMGLSARRRSRGIPFWQKALFAPFIVGGFLILGWTLQVSGLLTR